MDYSPIDGELRRTPRRWVVTGVAGFIGSHLLEGLLSLGQEVTGIDNFSTGHQHNLDDVRRIVGEDAWKRFRFVKGDITDPEACRDACDGGTCVLHQAALGSVPRSIEDPITSNRSNVDGFLTMAWAAKEAGIKRFVYASSSSVYGDDSSDTKREDRTGTLLSPYAVTKKVNELYADVFGPLYGMEFVGLRYFNVFGPRQDPNGPYAAVIPKWLDLLLENSACTIHGDGLTSRDFAYIKNVVQANILAASVSSDRSIAGRVFNIACGDSTSLKDLYALIAASLKELSPTQPVLDPIFGPFRTGDIRHSLAEIDAATGLLGYQPQYSVAEGMAETVRWYVERARNSRK